MLNWISLDARSESSKWTLIKSCERFYIFTQFHFGGPENRWRSHKNHCENVSSCDIAVCKDLIWWKIFIGASAAPSSHSLRRLTRFWRTQLERLKSFSKMFSPHEVIMKVNLDIPATSISIRQSSFTSCAESQSAPTNSTIKSFSR